MVFDDMPDIFDDDANHALNSYTVLDSRPIPLPGVVTQDVHCADYSYISPRVNVEHIAQDMHLGRQLLNVKSTFAIDDDTDNKWAINNIHRRSKGAAEGDPIAIKTEIGYRKVLHINNKRHFDTEIRRDVNYRHTAFLSLKYKRERSDAIAACSGVVAEDDTMLQLTFMRPYNRRPDIAQIRRGRLLKADVVCLVLGSMPLSSLADVPRCPSSSPSAVDPTVRGQESSTVYVEGTFYGKGDDAGAAMITPITSWMSGGRRYSAFNPREGMAAGDSMSMEHTLLRQLRLRLGQLYMYKHGQHCQHLFVVTDIRDVNGADCRDPSFFPVCTSDISRAPTKCELCNKMPAVFIEKLCASSGGGEGGVRLMQRLREAEKELVAKTTRSHMRKRANGSNGKTAATTGPEGEEGETPLCAPTPRQYLCGHCASVRPSPSHPFDQPALVHRTRHE